MRLWEVATGQCVRRVTNASQTSLACASPDGRRFAEAGADRNVRIRDGATLEVIREYRVHNAPVGGLGSELLTHGAAGLHPDEGRLAAEVIHDEAESGRAITRSALGVFGQVDDGEISG